MIDVDAATLTTKEFLKMLPVGSRWRIVHECHETIPHVIQKGHKWEEDATVHRVRRVRRQWDEPGKEIIFEVRHDLRVGYTTAVVNRIARIERHPEFVRVYFNHPGGGGIRDQVTTDYYPVGSS